MHVGEKVMKVLFESKGLEMWGGPREQVGLDLGWLEQFIIIETMPI